MNSKDRFESMMSNPVENPIGTTSRKSDLFDSGGSSCLVKQDHIWDMVILMVMWSAVTNIGKWNPPCHTFMNHLLNSVKLMLIAYHKSVQPARSITDKTYCNCIVIPHTLIESSCNLKYFIRALVTKHADDRASAALRYTTTDIREVGDGRSGGVYEVMVVT